MENDPRGQRPMFEPDDGDFGLGKRPEDTGKKFLGKNRCSQVAHVMTENAIKIRETFFPAPLHNKAQLFRFSDLITDFR